MNSNWNMKKLLVGLSLSALMINTCFAQKSVASVISATSSSNANMSTVRLQQIDKLLQAGVNDKWTNGAVALVIRNGKIAYYKSFGDKDIENKNPMQKDDIFRIASQTKAITSVAVMMLYEEGKFLLDDPISKYIPAFSNPRVLDTYNEKDTTYTTVAAKQEITIRQLLNHTSGISYAQIGEGAMNSIYAKNDIACGLGMHKKLLGDDIIKLAKLPLLHNPGEKFTYGLNVDVLGNLVEVVSHISLDEFFHKRIFEPLGMKDTYFFLPPEKQNRLVNLYIVDSAGRLNKSKGYFEVNGNVMKDYPKTAGIYYAGGAGLSSTVMDYAIFLQMLLNYGEYNGKRFLSRNTVRMMTMNQIGELNMDGCYKFGLGFRITTEKASSLMPMQQGTFSWGGYFSTVYWVDPKEKIVGLLYRQLSEDKHEDELGDKFKVMVYQAISD
ncbi:serine hydrolase domain-containing protein [soil metagenome]